MARKKYPSPPDTIDPTDWWMYCDLLQEAGAPTARWRWAKRVGDSLHAEPRLLLYAVHGQYLPRMLMHADRVYNRRAKRIYEGTAFPAWVRPSQLHLLRWTESKRTNDAIAGRLTFSERLELLEDAFTPDSLTTGEDVLALYNYACGYYRRMRPSDPDYGRLKLRQDFFACHGRAGVAEELDARRVWHV